MGCRSSKSSAPPLQRNHELESHRDSNLPLTSFTDDDIKRKLKDVAPVHRIVLTGGPCAGKSTMLSMLQTKLAQRTGIKVYTVPEAATLLVSGGLEWSDAKSDDIRLSYQLALLRVQLALEDQFYAIARASGRPSLIVSDRGTMDGRAYCSAETFQEIMRRGGWVLETLRDERYDAIVHMVSAAIGAKDFYNFDNPARYENADEAVLADERLRQMYVGHPLLRVFDNSTDFEEKLERVMHFVGQVVGHEFPHNLTRRFALSKPPNPTDITVPFVRSLLTITILHNSREDEVMQVIKREQDQARIYFYTCIKRRPSSKGRDEDAPSTASDAATAATSNEVIKSEHRISAREYASLLQQRDPHRVDVVKETMSFMHGSHYCEISSFVAPSWAVGQSTLYIESEKGAGAVDLPPFVNVERERVEDWASSFHISKRSNAPSCPAGASEPAAHPT